jgi:hypothetical protein
MAEQFEAPPPRLVYRRHVAPDVLQWVEQANSIMVENGQVQGTTVYRARHQARWRAQRLINLMVDLEMHERWQLAEHTYPRDGGWVWSVEYKGRRPA